MFENGDEVYLNKSYPNLSMGGPYTVLWVVGHLCLIRSNSGVERHIPFDSLTKDPNDSPHAGLPTKTGFAKWISGLDEKEREDV